jgi:hypothetical protein
MKEPHNYAHAGYGMIAVAASLTAIGLIALVIGGNGLFADHMQRENTAQFNECKDNNFQADECEKYLSRINNEASGVYVDLGK